VNAIERSFDRRMKTERISGNEDVIMNEQDPRVATLDRRAFLKTAGAGLTTAAVMLTPQERARAAAQAEKDKLDRIASCTWPIRFIFKSRPYSGPGRSTAPAAGGAPPVFRGNAGVSPQQMKEKYGEITMLDFPQWTRDNFPGVTHMDLFSGLFGDVTDDTMFAGRTFDPSTPSARKWLETLAAKMAATGTTCQHISNNAPTNLASSDDTLRKAGVDVAKKWMEACAILGVKSMRMNSPQALGPSIRPSAVRDPATGYPKNDEIVPMLAKAIESYKEMADVGGKLGIKATIENHWGLAADPINIRIIIDEVNTPFCEASPDFCNWEYDYLLVSGLKALAPYAHTNVHAKYWDRWGDKNDVQRSTRIMLASGYKGTFALEYEDGPLNGIEGAKYLFKEVMAALSSPGSTA
jgi:sugar phosphate isomerase/epimerase